MKKQLRIKVESSVSDRRGNVTIVKYFERILDIDDGFKIPYEDIISVFNLLFPNSIISFQLKNI